MTNKQLKAKIKECLKTDKKHIDKLIDKAIASGAIDIDGAINDYFLAKVCLCSIYKEMSRQYKPFTKEGRELTTNLDLFL